MRAKIRLQWSAREMLRISGVTEFSKTSQSNRWLASSLRSFSMYASATVAAVGCLVLVGWLFDIATLKSVIPDLVTIKANTAVAFVLAGLSLYWLRTEQVDQRRRLLAQACAATVALIGLLTLSEYLFGWDLGIDQLLFEEPLGAIGTSSPGRMAPTTALNFLLIGVALLLLDTRCPPVIFQSFALMAGLVAFLALLGYLYDAQALYAVAPYTGMALHTAALFFVLSLGLLLARPGLGLMNVVSTDNFGGVLARRLLPAAIVIPPALAWARLLGERAGFYGLEFGLALFALSNVLVFAAIIWWNAKLLNQMDVKRRQTEASLRGSEEMLRNLFEFAPDAIVTSDRDGLIVKVNSKVEAMFGYSRDELMGKSVETLIPEAVREAHVEHRAKYYSDPRSRAMGMGFWYDLLGRRKDGSTFPVDIGLSPLHIDGRFFVTAIIHDITEHKRAEEALHQKTVELERSNKVKDEFLSVMSHELRTPLNVIMGYAGMIKDGLLGKIDHEQEKAIGKVLGHSNDLLSMVSSIMQATSIEAGEAKVQIREVSLGNFLGELRSAYDVPFEKELTLKWHYPSELPVVKTDSGKLKQILQSLIDNAIRFTEKGDVTISVRHFPEAKTVEFKVADTGIGILKETLPAIFEKFCQADSSETRPYGGVGLGLYIVKKFTELLGGKVEVQSQPGKGSTFTVTIPCNQ